MEIGDIVKHVSNKDVLSSVLSEVFPEGFILIAKDKEVNEDMNMVENISLLNGCDTVTMLGLFSYGDAYVQSCLDEISNTTVDEGDEDDI